MSQGQGVVEAGKSRSKKTPLGASTSDCMAIGELSVDLFEADVDRGRRGAEIKRLEGRLRVLEEETETLKEALLKSVEGRAKLMNEIHKHFEIIQHCLLQGDLERGEAYVHGVQIIPIFKDRRAGLLQVLCQESNPSTGF